MSTYTRERALADLAAIYAELPEIHCKGLCWDTCTLIPASELEQDLVAAHGRPLLPLTPAGKRQLVDAGDGLAPADLRCPNLGPLGNCTVYDVRPLICRAYGSFRDSACQHGCLSPVMMMRAEFGVFIRRVAEVSKRWIEAGRP